MKQKRKLRIELKELPVRAVKLDPDDVSKVFGGCGVHNSPCVPDKDDCCDNWSCKYIVIGFFCIYD